MRVFNFRPFTCHTCFLMYEPQNFTTVITTKQNTGNISTNYSPSECFLRFLVIYFTSSLYLTEKKTQNVCTSLLRMFRVKCSDYKSLASGASYETPTHAMPLTRNTSRPICLWNVHRFICRMVLTKEVDGEKVHQHKGYFV